MNDTEFRELCATGSCAEIEAAIRAGADVNAKMRVEPPPRRGFGSFRPASGLRRGEAYGLVPLHFAARSNPDPEVITTLVNAGADVNAQDGTGLTSLHYAVVYNPEVLDALINAGADLNVRESRGETPLHFAAAFSPDPTVITTLLNAGVSVNEKGTRATSRYRWTPLHAAAQTNPNPKVTAILLHAGADVHGTDETFTTPLHSAATSSRNPDVPALLLHAGADVNAKH